MNLSGTAEGGIGPSISSRTAYVIATDGKIIYAHNDSADTVLLRTTRQVVCTGNRCLI